MNKLNDNHLQNQNLASPSEGFQPSLVPTIEIRKIGGLSKKISHQKINRIRNYMEWEHHKNRMIQLLRFRIVWLSS